MVDVVANQNGKIEEGKVIGEVDDISYVQHFTGDFKISMIPNGDIRAWIHLDHNENTIAEIQFDYRKR